MRILIRTSKWAIWSRRLGSFAVPLVIVPVLLHRERFIDSDAFHVLAATAVAIAALAVLFGLIGVIRLWFTGDRGWGKAIAGMLLGLVCLAPAGYVAAEAVRYPMLIEASTDFADPPELVSPGLDGPPPEGYAELVAEAFPNAATRHYPVEVTGMFELVEGLALAQGWEVRLRRAPLGTLGEGRFNAVATALLGWREEVALRLRGDAAGTAVDMRSASLAGWHDLGRNGRRIEAFLATLDEAVLIAVRDSAPALETDQDEDNGEGPEVDIGE